MHILDDHELFNDYAGNGTSASDPKFVAANPIYAAYNGLANPSSIAGQNYYFFRYGDAAFFVMVRDRAGELH